MIENEVLMKFAADEDDVPVALCIVKNTIRINWKENLPDEVLYIPERKFESIARDFINELGEDYYGSTGLTKGMINNFKETLSNRYDQTENESIKSCIREMRKFIEKGEFLSETHYLVFEGP